MNTEQKYETEVELAHQGGPVKVTASDRSIVEIDGVEYFAIDVKDLETGILVLRDADGWESFKVSAFSEHYANGYYMNENAKFREVCVADGGFGQPDEDWPSVCLIKRDILESEVHEWATSLTDDKEVASWNLRETLEDLMNTNLDSDVEWKYFDQLEAAS
jgi:hypothetical protein